MKLNNVPGVVIFSVTQHNQKQTLHDVKCIAVTICNRCINMTIRVSTNKEITDGCNHVFASMRHVEFR